MNLEIIFPSILLEIGTTERDNFLLRVFTFNMCTRTEQQRSYEHRSSANTERPVYHDAKPPADVSIPSGKILTARDRDHVKAPCANYYSADRLTMPSRCPATGITSDVDCVRWTSAPVNALYLVYVMSSFSPDDFTCMQGRL